MNYTLENSKYIVRVATKGAELLGLYSKETELEYMWQGASEAWPAHSLLLFPCCGRIDRSRIIAKGKQHALAMHGFAKDMEFEVLEAGATKLTLQLAYNADTLRAFPYKFGLRVEFELFDDKIEQRFTVLNWDEAEMPFSLGGHPAFFCPVDLDSEAEDCVLEFDCDQKIKNFALEKGTRLVKKDEYDILVDGTTLPLSNYFFNNGPKVLGGVDAKYVRLLSKKTGHYMEMGIEGFPFMTLWGVGDRMTIIAIEPWCGTSDISGTDHVWETKYGNEKVASGDKWERKFVFKLG